MKKQNFKRVAALTLAGLMAASALAGCGGTSSSGGSTGGDATKGKVYYLNFKPEQDKAWQDLAAKYTEETGVEVVVKTAAEGTYESTLTA